MASTPKKTRAKKAGTTTKKKRRRAAASGTTARRGRKDVRRKVHDLTVKALRDREIAVRDIPKLAQKMIQDAAAELNQAVPQSSRSRLRQVVDGFTDARTRDPRILGVAENLGAGFLPGGSSYKDGIGYAILIAVLLLRPQGLFGRA